MVLGECLFCGSEMPMGLGPLLIRDPMTQELKMMAKNTVVNIKRREREQKEIE